MKTTRHKTAESSVREKLLRAAVELFTTRGYAATSVREIVEAAGVTKPALYYHFASKEGLYLAILQDLRKMMDDAVAAHQATTGSARNRIETFLLGLFDLFERNQAGARFINAAFWGPAQGAPRFDFECMHQQLMAVVTQLVAAGLASGEVRRSVDPQEAASVLMGLLSFSMDLTLAHPKLARGQGGLRRALDLIFKGVAAPAPTRRETAR